MPAGFVVQFVDLSLSAARVFALGECGFCDERALAVVDHYAGFVVVAGALLARGVRVGLAYSLEFCLVAARLLRASVELVLNSVAEVFDCLNLV